MRPEYEKCVLLTIKDRKNETWCDRRKHSFEWCFLDVDHAALNGRAEARQIVCKGCLKEIIKSLNNGY